MSTLHSRPMMTDLRPAVPELVSATTRDASQGLTQWPSTHQVPGRHDSSPQQPDSPGWQHSLPDATVPSGQQNMACVLAGFLPGVLWMMVRVAIPPPGQHEPSGRHVSVPLLQHWSVPQGVVSSGHRQAFLLEPT